MAHNVGCECPSGQTTCVRPFQWAASNTEDGLGPLVWTKLKWTRETGHY
jgi:hypothetical protein